MDNESISLEKLLCMFCADIDIFLLQDETQKNDLDKIYTKEEIREQLKRTLIKFNSLSIEPKVYKIPLFPTLMKYVYKIN
jgi:hypothetical protein